MGDGHRISVVIPTVGRPSLAACLEGLRCQTRPAEEIIVVEDPARRGPAWARNEGIRRASGDLIAFTDDDCVPPATWLADLTQAIDEWDAGGAGGTYDEIDPFYQAIRKRRDYPTGNRVDDGGWVGTGGNVMYRGEWLGRCQAQDGHVFNERFRFSQDWELTWRLRQYGARLVFSNTRVRHLRRATSRTHLQQQFQHGRGIALLYRAQRVANADVVHRSLLWGRPGSPAGPRWARALWQKGIGPFDLAGFGSPRRAALFWLGEKFQGAGFLWQRVVGAFQSPPGGMGKSGPCESA